MIRQVGGAAEADDVPKPVVEQLSTVKRDEYQVERFVFRVSPELKLPGLLFVPNEPTGKATVYLHDDGKAAEAGADREIARLVKARQMVLAIDVAGCGETRMKPWRYGSMSGVLGPNSAEFYVAYMLGQSFVGLRAEQILMATQWLRAHTLGALRIDLVATGELTVPALHAAVLEPDLFDLVEVRGGLDSWQSVVDRPVTERQLINVVHGVLRYYDLPDLRAMIPTGSLKVSDPRDAAGQPLAVN